MDVLHDPFWNKGTGFPLEERDALGIRGLVPPSFYTLQEQADKVFESVMERPTQLDRWQALQALQDRNETLYFKVHSSFLFVVHSSYLFVCSSCVLKRPLYRFLGGDRPREGVGAHRLYAHGGRGLPAVQPPVPPRAGHVLLRR